MLEESTAPVFLEPIAEQSEEYTLQYPLTKLQKQISDACLANITQTDVLLKCVCGAGKTGSYQYSESVYSNLGL